MAGTSDFLPFATSGTPDVISQAAYTALAARGIGFNTGTALSNELNKVWRQSAFQAAVVAQFVANVLNINVNDDGNLGAGITNFTNAVAAAAAGLATPFANLASAGTTNLGTIASRNVNVTGTAAITSFGSAASLNQPIYVVTFASALTLTNSGSLLLPGGGNLKTAARDALLAEYLGAGNWQVLAYFPATPEGGAFTNLASAGTTDLGTIPTHNVNVTGTTLITSFGSSATLFRPLYYVTFAGSLTLTNSGSLILPGNGNIVTQARDAMLVEYLGSGNWQVLAYFAADAASPLMPRTRLVVWIDGATGNQSNKVDPAGYLTAGATRSSAGVYALAATGSWPANAYPIITINDTAHKFAASFAGNNSVLLTINTYDASVGTILDCSFVVELKW